MSGSYDRRDFLKRAVTASSAAALGLGWEDRNLMARTPDSLPAPAPAGSLDAGRIGPLEVSRIFCGGNLMGGWAHSRDLMYVSPLVKAYHTDKKVVETLALAEAHGMNTVLTNPVSARVINTYRREHGGGIQWISDCALDGDVMAGIRISVEQNADACYVQGGIADGAVRVGDFDLIARALELMRSLGVPAGIGAHMLETVEACIEYDLIPDFWVKTLHHDQYWSATPRAERPADSLPPHDNMYCTNPAETIAYMTRVEQPWIAFKVLAAGAIPPAEGFRFAFEGGADFVCVGMFDFQIAEDARIASDVLADPRLSEKRPRPWRA